MAVSATSAAEGDAELSAEMSEDDFRYAGVFPDGVETVACISPASYPGSPKHRRGGELLEKAGLINVRVYKAFTYEAPDNETERVYFTAEKPSG